MVLSTKGQRAKRIFARDETPVVIPPSAAVTIYPKGTPVPTPTVEVQVLETRVDLSNDMTWRQM